MRHEFDISELSSDGNPSHDCDVNVLTLNMAYLRISTMSNFFIFFRDAQAVWAEDRIATYVK